MKAVLFTLFPGICAFRLGEHSTRALSKVDLSCNSTFDCGRGFCIEKTSCRCEDGWYSAGAPCDYEQKKQLTVFLIAVFTGYTGSAQFYTCDYPLAGLKLLLLLCPCIACCGICCGAACTSQPEKSGTEPAKNDKTADEYEDARWHCLGCSLGLAISAWWLADCIIIGLNRMDDRCESPAVPLTGW